MTPNPVGLNKTMNDIISTLKSGAARERLAVIADIFGIGGISLAAVVGGLMALPTSIRVPELVGAVVYSLLCLALALCGVAFVIVAVQWMWSRFASHPLVRNMVVAAAISVTLALFITAAFAYSMVMGSFRIAIR